MQTRSDHVQAYQFATARMSSALVTGTTHQGDAPMRRSSMGVITGAVIGVLICVAALVVGLISPGGATSWKLPRTIVVEKETGNRYLYIDGVLRPTLNTASAMLYFGSDGGPATFRQVSRKSLVGVPHGAPVGIPGAPDSVPQPGSMLAGDWILCAIPGPAVATTLGMGGAPGAAPVAGELFVVRAPDGQVHVIIDDIAHAVRSPAVLVALGLGDVLPTPVPALWLDVFATGAPLEAPVIPQSREPGPPVAGRPGQIGQVYQVAVAGETQNYVLRRDGLAPLNPTAAALLSTRSSAAPVAQLSAEDMATSPLSADESGLRDIPDVLGGPVHDMPDDTICAYNPPSDGTTLPAARLRIVPGLLDARSEARMPPGTGVLVAAMPRPEPGSSKRPQQWLVTDQGIRFPMSDQAAAVMAGGAPLTWLPPVVLESLPQGPPLVTGPTVLTGGPGKVF